MCIKKNSHNAFHDGEYIHECFHGYVSQNVITYNTDGSEET